MADPTPLSPGLRLCLAGAPRWLGDNGSAVELHLLDALLLAWLALEGATAREDLAALLWPQSSAATARNALRQRLFRLRKLCGRELVAGTTTLALAPGITHDLADAPTLLGPLNATGLDEIEAWLARQRAQRQAASRHETESRIEALEAAGDAAAALPLALALLEAEPLSEDAHRRVMRLHYLRGDRAAAVLAFDRCEQLLKHEVGTAPGAETLALLGTIEAGVAAAPPAGAAAWPTAVPISVLRPPRLIGRQTELQALRQGWQAAHVVLVTGEAGMGKSRLLQCLATESPGLLLSAGRPGDALVPYATLARLLHAVVERAPLALDEPLRQRLSPLLPSWAPTATGAASKPGLRRAELLGPVQQLLQSARTSFDGLVLDDVHFSDGASLELLQGLLATPRPVAAMPDPIRWCLGLRPSAPGSRLQALVDALGTAAPLTHVPLPPLDVAQMVELVDSLNLPGVAGADFAPALRQRTGGNPLFALETLKLAWAEGLLHSRSELPRPQSLAQLIGQQLARLSPAAMMLARLAAIAGVDFSLPLAAQVLGQNALQLADPWHELEQQQVLQGTDFAHDLIFEAVLAGVPSVIARHLHAQVAEQLQARIDKPGGEHTGEQAAEPARVAAHWEAAGQRERALPGLRAAAHKAHLALREPERIEFLLRAADIAEAAGDRDLAFECVASAVDSHMNTIRQASGFPLLDRLDRLAGQARRRALALGQRAWYCSQLADNAGAVRTGEQALALAEPLGDHVLSTQIRQRLATALSMLGRFDVALHHMQAAQPWADELLQPEDRAEFHGNFAVVLDNLGRPDLAAGHRQQALEAGQAAGDPALQVSLLANHAVSRLGAGDVQQARSLVVQAQRLIAVYDMQGSTAGFAAVLQMQCARALGHFDEALAAAELAEAQLRQSLPARLPVVALQRAQCWLDLGQHARASQDLQAAGGDLLPPHFEARRLVLLARLQRLLGQDAAAPLQRARAVAPPHGWPDVALIIDTEAALLLPGDEALALLQRTVEQAQRLGLQGALLSALLRRAQIRAAHGDAGAAADAQQALALAVTVEPTLLGRAEVWLHSARALLVARGDAAAAAQASATLRTGRDWLLLHARQHVPQHFRESFLQRCPVNRELLALADQYLGT